MRKIYQDFCPGRLAQSGECSPTNPVIRVQVHAMNRRVSLALVAIKTRNLNFSKFFHCNRRLHHPLESKFQTGFTELKRKLRMEEKKETNWGGGQKLIKDFLTAIKKVKEKQRRR